MESSDWFQVAAGAASIASFVFVIGSGAEKWYRAAAESRRQAQEELEKACRLVADASSSVSARSDLNAYVQLELSRQRQDLEKCRFNHLRMSLLAPACGIAGILIQGFAKDSVDSLFVWVLMLLMCYGTFSLIRWRMRESDMEKSIEAYQNSAQAVWLDHISKRLQ